MAFKNRSVSQVVCPKAITGNSYNSRAVHTTHTQCEGHLTRSWSKMRQSGRHVGLDLQSLITYLQQLCVGAPNPKVGSAESQQCLGVVAVGFFASVWPDFFHVVDCQVYEVCDAFCIFQLLFVACPLASYKQNVAYLCGQGKAEVVRIPSNDGRDCSSCKRLGAPYSGEGGGDEKGRMRGGEKRAMYV